MGINRRVFIMPCWQALQAPHNKWVAGSAWLADLQNLMWSGSSPSRALKKMRWKSWAPIISSSMCVILSTVAVLRRLCSNANSWHQHQLKILQAVRCYHGGHIQEWTGVMDGPVSLPPSWFIARIPCSGSSVSIPTQGLGRGGIHKAKGRVHSTLAQPPSWDEQAEQWDLRVHPKKLVGPRWNARGRRPCAFHIRPTTKLEWPSRAPTARGSCFYPMMFI